MDKLTFGLGLSLLGGCTMDNTIVPKNLDNGSQDTGEAPFDDQDTAQEFDTGEPEETGSSTAIEEDEDPETPTQEITYEIDKVFSACSSILNNDQGHCILVAETGLPGENCEESVEEVGDEVLGDWYEGVSDYFGYEVNEANVSAQDWTVFSWNDGNPTEDGYAATIVIAPGHHSIFFPEGWTTPFDPVELPVLRCSNFPGSGDTYSGYTGPDGEESAEANFSFDEDWYDTNEDLVNVNGSSWHTGTGETWSTSSESAAGRITSGIYEVSMDVANNPVGVVGYGYAHF